MPNWVNCLKIFHRQTTLFNLSGSAPAILTLLVTIGLLYSFVREKIRTDQAVMIAVALLLFLGILAPSSVLGVLNNSAPITIACLFIVSAALERTGCIHLLGHYLGTLAGRKERGLLITLCLAAMLISPFINNTPVVVVLIPVAISLANQRNLKPSKFLIPLSYASIFGGLCTMIGTSTNLLVDGMARQYGLAPFSMFEISIPAIILASLGLFFIVVLAPRLLPERVTLSQQLSPGSQRTFMAELLVPKGSRLANKSLLEANLATGDTRVHRLFRDDQDITEPSDSVCLQEGDRILVHSQSRQLLDFNSSELIGVGLSGKPDLEALKQGDAMVVECIVGRNSRYLNRPMRDLDLAARYGIHVLAVHRQDANISGVLDDFELQFGDVLLVEGQHQGIHRFCDNGDLITINSKDKREIHQQKPKAIIAMTTVAAIMLLAAFNIMSIEGLAIIGAVVVIATGCLTTDQAYKSVDWPILILIYGMLCISVAMQQTGLLQYLADGLIWLGQDSHPLLVLLMVLVVTSLTTEVLSNNAVAVLFTPLVILVAQQLGFDPRPFVVAVMFAASACFITPIGYQTNTLVYNAGAYKFRDFFRLGLIMNILVWAAGVLLIPLFWPLVA